ncbi:MAG: DUF362 domain-containing protein [Dissulfurispiraceae bacterium]
MPTVIVTRTSYDYDVLRPAIFLLLDRFSGPSIRRTTSVILKPNFLAPAPPEKAMLTHPLIVRAVAEYVVRKGAVPVISDSNAMGSFEKVLRTGGFLSALEGLDVEFREFKKTAVVDIGEPFGKIEIAGEALNAEVLINLPKLKTHTQMLLTLGVKNLFGCIVGLRKPEWHFRTGVDREMFAQLLVRIHAAVNPAVTILDGVLAMEGQGPGRGGIPRHLGVIMGSNSAVALDISVCRMLGLPAEDLLTNKMTDKGLLDPIEIEGNLPQINDFRLPLITPLVFGPSVLHGLMRRHLVQRPEVDQMACVTCGACWKYCPVRAINPDNGTIVFDYEKCIRCYCCIEVCPQGALTTRETLAGKTIRKILKR